MRLTDGDQEVILSTARRAGDPLPRGRRPRRWAATPPACAASRSTTATRWSRSTWSTPDTTLLAVAENGYGKRTALDEYRLTSRGGKGIITMNVTDRIGRVVGVRMVRDDDDIMLITDGGKVIRMPVRDISVIGRNTQGVRLIGLAEGEKVVGVACVAEMESSPRSRATAKDPEPEPAG